MRKYAQQNKKCEKLIHSLQYKIAPWSHKNNILASLF